MSQQTEDEDLTRGGSLRTVGHGDLPHRKTGDSSALAEILRMANDVVMYCHLAVGDLAAATKIRRGLFRESTHGDGVTLKRAMGFERYRRRYERSNRRRIAA